MAGQFGLEPVPYSNLRANLEGFQAGKQPFSVGVNETNETL